MNDVMYELTPEDRATAKILDDVECYIAEREKERLKAHEEGRKAGREEARNEYEAAIDQAHMSGFCEGEDESQRFWSCMSNYVRERMKHLKGIIRGELMHDQVGMESEIHDLQARSNELRKMLMFARANHKDL